jgi:threonine dehydrogenase-like Zn-dependent dehydrogenase
MIFGVSIVNLIVAILAATLIIRSGLAVLRGMAAPIPEPPPPGELRKVKIQFRCAICGTEVRMTAANDQEPEAPRHCMQEMDLVAPIE